MSYASGKWTATVVKTGFQGDFGNDAVNSFSLPVVGQYAWAFVRSELNDNGDGTATKYEIYQSGSEFIQSGQTASTPASQEEWSASVSLQNQPISMHQNIASLVAKYKGKIRESEWVWPEVDPTGASTRTGTNKSGNTIYGVNPMYGIQEFLSPTMSVTRKQVKRGYGLEISSNFGHLEDPPSSCPINVPRGQQGSGASTYGFWLRSADQGVRHGNDTEISTSWEYAQHGWNKIIYSADTI